MIYFIQVLSLESLGKHRVPPVCAHSVKKKTDNALDAIPHPHIQCVAENVIFLKRKIHH